MKITYTLTDEAPMLATCSLLPVIRAFTKSAGIEVELKDISLAGRILAEFSDLLPEDQRVPDALAELGELVKNPEANIIKLPNISASLPQIQSAVSELQSQGFALPNVPEEPKTDEEKNIRARYDRVKGSAVNPVLREGNSDRRCAPAVKQYARRHPHSMGEWSADSKTHTASMKSGDFYGSECSVTLKNDLTYRIEFADSQGNVTELKGPAKGERGDILDAAVMNCRALREFLEDEMRNAEKQNLLFSLHLKATMMKVSDPVIFGHAVSVFFRDVFEKHTEVFGKIGIDPDLGMADLLQRVANLEDPLKTEIMEDIQAAYASRPELAMVDSERGISNLHVPSDVIIDASMPAAIRNSGRMWGPDGQPKDIKAVIPDRSYAAVYQTVIDFCRRNGAFNPANMGSVSNVGLMASKAEEYGSHDKTFIAGGSGVIRALDTSGQVILEQSVEQGDIFRMCQTKDAAVRDWTALALRRAEATGSPAIFWLDPNRAHDRCLTEKVNTYLKESEAAKHEITIMSPADACRYTLERSRNNQDTISVTGNVLRDYLTDLFPILELGTSAKMLSVVPLMNGGGLFETGAGGSAPKHVHQLLDFNHLRWDSLGEILALAVSLEHLADRFDSPRVRLLARTLDAATAQLLEQRKSPLRRTGEPDNRSSHYYLALYWARELAGQNDDLQLKERFSEPARQLAENELDISAQLTAVQGRPADIGGYYRPDPALLEAVMRPCSVLNFIIDSV